MRVQLSAGGEAALRAYGEAAYPHEGCGVMIGHIDGDMTIIDAVTSGKNLVTDRSHDRYLLDPGAIVEAERTARTRALDVVGFWHTHPDHPAWPSQFDDDHAWTDYVYVICRVANGICELINAFILPDAGQPFVQVDMTSERVRSGG